MCDDLRQNGLCLVTKCIIGCVVSMSRKLERLRKLPLEIYSQADGNLISSKAKNQFRDNSKELLSNKHTYPSSASLPDFLQECIIRAGLRSDWL